MLKRRQSPSHYIMSASGFFPTYVPMSPTLYPERDRIASILDGNWYKILRDGSVVVVTVGLSAAQIDDRHRRGGPLDG